MERLTAADLAGAEIVERLDPGDLEGAEDVTNGPNVDTATTLGLNATNLFGAGAAIGGAVNSVVRGGSYAEWRDKFRAALEQGNEQHPGAKWIGRGIALAAETAVGGAAGKALGAAGKAIGFAPKFSGPIAQQAAKGFVGGAGYGAAGGAGEALSKGEDVVTGAIKGASIGSLLGAGIGGAAGKIAQKFRSSAGPAPEVFKVIDDAIGGGVEASLPVEMLRNKAATEGSQAASKALLAEADRLQQLYSTIATDEAKNVLINRVPKGDQTARDALEKLAESIPDGKVWTKENFLDHLAGGDSKKAWDAINPTLRREVEQMPWRYDPSYKVPISILNRDHLQTESEAAKQVIGAVLGKELGRAAATNDAAKIAADEVARLGKQSGVGAKASELAHAAPKLLSGYELLHAGHAALTGDLVGAAKHVVGAAFAHKAADIVKLAKSLSSEAIAGMARAARAGDKRAAELLAAVQAVQSAATNVAVNAPVGATTQSTLGGGQ